MNFKKRLFLFWKIGKVVFQRQKYYENAVLKYSNFFSYCYGMSETFSVNNIHYMKRFYSCFPIYVEELNKLTFEHYKLLVNVYDAKTRYFYFRVALFCRSSVEELKGIILNDVYNCI